MSGTTPNLGLTYLVGGQLQPEVTVNEDLNILDGLASAFAAFGYNPGASYGLLFYYYGGSVYQDGVATAVAAGHLTLADNSTNYVQRRFDGSLVLSNTTGFLTGYIPVAKVVTSGGVIQTVTDARPSVYGPSNGGTIGVGQPTGITVTASATGGTIAASTTYDYVLTAVYPWGESAPTPVYSVTTSSSSSTNSVVISWTVPAGATSVNVYRAPPGSTPENAGGAVAPTATWTDAGNPTTTYQVSYTGSIEPSDTMQPMAVLTATGALVADSYIFLPNLSSKTYVIANETTGNFKLYVSDALLHNPVSIPQGGAVYTGLDKNANLWAFSTAGSLAALITTLGDLVVGGSGGTPARLPIGSDGQVLTVTSGVSGLTASWSTPASGMPNPMTSLGDLIQGGTSGSPGRLPIGAQGQVLTVSASGTAQWDNNPAGFTNPMTTLGDLILALSGGAAARLPIGASGQVLTVTSGASGLTASWENNPAGFSNPMTTPNDIIIGGTGGSATRLASGGTGQVLTSTASGVAWEAPTGGFTDPMTSAGDLILGGTSGSATRLASGSVGQVLTSTASGVAWAAGGAGSSVLFRAHSTVNQSLPYNAFTQVSFDTVDFDTASAYSTSTNELTLPAGTYQIGAYASIYTNSSQPAGNFATLRLYKNGAFYSAGDQASIDNQDVHVGLADLVEVNGTDTLAIYAISNASGTIEIQATDAGQATFFYAIKVG